jgi:hypothetical protein
MAGLSGMQWCERYLSTTGFIGENIDHDVTAREIVCHHLVVKGTASIPGGAGASIWELLPDDPNVGENLIRLNYTGGVLTTSDNYDLVFNTDAADTGTQNARLMFIGSDAGVTRGIASFRAGVATGTEWDPPNRGIASTAFGVNNRAIGNGSTVAGGSGNDINVNADNGFIGCGQSNSVQATDSATVGGSNNDVQPSAVECAIVAGAGGTISTAASQCAIIGGSSGTVDTGVARSVQLGGLNQTVNTTDTAAMQNFKATGFIQIAQTRTINFGGFVGPIPALDTDVLLLIQNLVSTGPATISQLTLPDPTGVTLIRAGHTIEIKNEDANSQLQVLAQGMLVNITASDGTPDSFLIVGKGTSTKLRYDGVGSWEQLGENSQVLGSGIVSLAAGSIGPIFDWGVKSATSAITVQRLGIGASTALGFLLVDTITPAVVGASGAFFIRSFDAGANVEAGDASQVKYTIMAA